MATIFPALRYSFTSHLTETTEKEYHRYSFTWHLIKSTEEEYQKLRRISDTVIHSLGIEDYQILFVYLEFEEEYQILLFVHLIFN